MSRQRPPVLAPLWALRIQDGEPRRIPERAAVEVPFELRLNGRSHTLLMISPQAVEELARGFCLSEGLVDEPAQVRGVEVGWDQVAGVGPVVWADVSLPRELARRARVRRVAPAATSCGLCGLESFSQLAARIAPVHSPGFRVELARLFELVRVMEASQPTYEASGGTHAACLARPQGRLLAVREDVGRHNALDKVLGWGAGQGQDLGRCLVLLSGRISYEMALKVARAGVPLVGSVSAPTALGVRLLERLGVTLVGFIRRHRATVFTHPRRVTGFTPPEGDVRLDPA